MKKILNAALIIVLLVCVVFFANKFGIISLDELFGDEGIKVENKVCADTN